jgi:ribonuclease R
MSNKNKSSFSNQKQEVINFLSSHTERPYTIIDLLNHFNIYDEDDKLFFQLVIEELLDERKIKSAGRKRYVIAANMPNNEELITGKVDFVNPKFAFIRYDDTASDVYVDANDLNGAWDGDTVKVQLIASRRKKGNNPEGIVKEIVKRGKTQVVGKARVFGNYALVKPDNRRVHEDIFISKNYMNGATKDDLVIVEIVEYAKGSTQTIGKIVEVLGKSGDNTAEMHAIMAEFGLPIKFPEGVEAAAEAISTEISAEEIFKRRDMRGTLTYTIDPHDAKDFDDALSFKVLENGNFEIGVHIADVTHYVQPGTLIEEEAYRRATSVYLVDRTIPMLPEKLSNNLCSLRPNEDKLVFSAVFELNQYAQVLNQWFGRAIIHSDKRFAYEEAQEVLDREAAADKSDMPNPIENHKFEQELTHSLLTFNALALRLRKERFQKGAFNFETNEVKFNLDETGRPIGVYQKIRKDAHKLIEEFMLLANKLVAEHVYNELYLDKTKRQKTISPENSPTMIYRVHEPPNPEKLDTFSKFAAKLGFVVKTHNQDVLASSLNKLMSEIEGTGVQNVLESLAIRTMSKAKYSTNPLGHFGLAFEHYSHFTSPIRRYPDMIAHRMLQHYIDKGKSLNREDFEEKCKHTSEQEKLAAEAERASIKYKQVEYMSYQDHRLIFEGVVSGVTDFGIFVEISGTGCEGMVRLADLNDDYYEYDASNFRVVGQRQGKVLTFGDKVKVSIKTTDLEKRSMDLLLVEANGKSIKTSSKSEFNRVGRSDRKKTSRSKDKSSRNKDKGKPKRKKN